MRAILKLFLILSLVPTGIAACASKKTAQDIMDERQAGARPSRDTLWTDRFYQGQPTGPSRDVQSWEFFYKDCELARRSRQPTRSEWDCKEP